MAEPFLSTRRGALRAASVAVAAGIVPVAAPAQAQSPILAQAQRVAALYCAEASAFDQASVLEGTPAHEGAMAKVDAIYADWEGQMAALAAMPAATTQDVVVKLAAVLWTMRDNTSDEEYQMADALLGDIWRVCPELRPVLRWSPEA